MATIIIDGVEHEFSTDWDLGEARVIKRYTGLTLRGIDGVDPSDPDLIAAFIHITLRRANPLLTFPELEGLTEAVKLAEIDMREDRGVEVVPPAPSEPSETPGSASETGTHSNGSQAPSPETMSHEITGSPV